ncbi:MAG TPA: TonB-dependent receptor [Bryobacteraceae bacterium]|nr:TonB-dependent receptor [Bryobacteraceae bacterium]
MFRNFRSVLILLAIALWSTSPGSVRAQVSTADIVGTVTDQAGAVITEATVTVENADTRDRRTATTSGSGEFVFNLLQAGRYIVTVQAKGFKQATTNLTVSAGDRARANMELQVGDVAQAVEVQAQSPALQSDSATLSTVMASQSVQDLPLNGRNFVTLIQSTVGIAAGPSNSILSGTRPDERRQTANVIANGQNETFNNQMIDGMDNNEREQFTILMRPSIDMIAEVKVDTNTYPAEVGRAGGAVVNLLTKSGTNGFHGGLYEFLRNDKLNANDFFSNLSGVPRPEYRQNQFGGSIGGPIRKDKTFFFGDVEALRIVQGVPTGQIFTPTLFEEQNPGNFSDQPGGKIIPPSQLDPVALKYWKLFPAPNVGAPGFLGANYNANVTKTYNSTTYDARVDHHFSDKTSMFGRFSYNPTYNSQPALFPNTTVDGVGVSAGGGIFPGPSEANSQGYMLDFVHILSPTLLVELKAGFTRLWLYTSAPNQGSNASQKFGMPNTDVSDQISGLATIDIVPMRAVGSSFTIGDDRFVPILDINNVFQEQGSLTWTRGTHNIKTGASLIRRQLNYYQNTFGLGYFRFTQSELIDLQNFLQGTPDEIQRQINPKRQYFRFWEPAVYVQDDWRAKPWLTLNLGLRWDHFSPITAAQGERSNFDPVLAAACTPASCNPFRVGATAGVKSYYTNFEPRFGFAATPRPSFVIRGGFGMSRYAQDYASGSMNLYNPPFVPLNLDCFPQTGTGASACPAGTGRLSQGAPPVTVPTINNQLPGTVGAHAVDYPQAYIMQWNLTFQKQVGANVFSAGYVGQVARHLQYAPNINIPPPSQAGLGVYNPRVFAGVMPNLASINYYTATGAAEYNAMQVSFERRYARGLTANANYTFARNLTNISDGGTTGAATVGAILPNNRAYDWGNSDIGIKHRISFRLNYELPFGKSGSKLTKFTLGGWQANLLAFYQSGVPFTVLDTATPVPSNVSNLVTVDRPNVVAGQPYAPANQSYTNWINVNAFTPQPVGTVGSEMRSQLYGPHQRSADFSLFKDFAIRESIKLQFRAEVYNITNTENFGQPNINITKWSSTLAGVGTGAPGATPILGAGGFGQITQSNLALNPRQYQFALKLIF